VSELEEILFNDALEVVSYESILEARGYKSNRVQINYFNKGCIDGIIYDNNLECFTHLVYPKGIGKGITFDDNSTEAYFDDVEYIEIEIPHFNPIK